MKEPESYLTIDGYLFNETEKAYGIRLKPTDPRDIWIPRSLTNGIVKFKTEGDFNTGTYRFCRVQVADWFCEREGLI